LGIAPKTSWTAKIVCDWGSRSEQSGSKIVSDAPPDSAAHQAIDKSGDLAGEEVIIARSGEPVAKLVRRNQSKRSRKLGEYAGRINRSRLYPLSVPTRVGSAPKTPKGRSKH